MKLEKEKIILTVSSIDPRKNLVRLVNAFSRLETEYKLVIVGSKNNNFSGVEFKDVEKNENISFTGYLEDKDLIKLYNKAEIFAYVSLFEGFGIPPLEAQACYTTCLVSNTTALPEIYGDSVEYCDPYSEDNIKEGIETLINNTNLRESLKKKGLENSKRYNWEDSAKSFVNIMECIL